jgi:hypothetical protein
MKHTASSYSLPLRAALCLALITLLFSACALPKIQLPSIAGAPAKEGGVAAVDSANPAAPADPAAPKPTGTASDPTDTPVSGEITVQDGVSGLILFTSLSNDPFASSDAGKVSLPDPQRHLWSISPDGKRTGRLSPEGYATALVPVSKPEGKILVMSNGLELTGDAVLAALPPQDCQDNGAACSAFEFGMQGRTFAYLSSATSCGKTMTLVERATGNPINTWENVTWFHFNQDGGLIISLSDCTNNYVYQYIPNTGIQTGMAADGAISWDPSQRAALVQLSGASPLVSALWGFNLDTNRAILWHDQGNIMQDSPVWLADGRHFVYQHRVVRYDKESGNAYLDGPRQIILMDAWTRAQHLLAFNGSYDFHLCPSEGKPCQQPYGDWLKVTRTPFVPVGLKLGSPDEIAHSRCPLYGLDCMKPAEEFALNWKTGEMLPWADANLPAPQSAPAYPPPDQSKSPIYSDPDGAFSLYTSADGRALWSVPASGDPLLLVTEGENFVYVP